MNIEYVGFPSLGFQGKNIHVMCVFAIVSFLFFYWKSICSKILYKVKIYTPLMRTAKVVVEMQLMTQFMKGNSNPKWVRSIRIFNQLTWSYTFDKSIFITVPFNFHVLMLCIPSCSIPIAWWIYLPSRNPNCSLDIDSKRIYFSILSIVFSTTL
jgi:hypothetical protein